MKENLPPKNSINYQNSSRAQTPERKRPTNLKQNSQQDMRVRQSTVSTPNRQRPEATVHTQANIKREAQPIVKNQTPKKVKAGGKSIIKKLLSPLTEPPKAGKTKRNDFIKPTDVVRIKGSFDSTFLILVIILTLFGLVMDFSASYAYAFNRYGDSFHFVKSQLIFAAVGFIGMFFAIRFDYKWIRKFTVPAFLVSIVLLIGVLLYGFAAGVAQRWINLGFISLQPSEIAKLTVVLMLALYVARNQDRITNYRNVRQSSFYGMIIPFMILGIVCVLVALEKHFSGTIIIFLIGMVIIFAAGARLSWFIAAGIFAIVAIFIAITCVPYAMERINMLRFPENYDPTGEIWQTLQGLYAVGSGGLFGVGLGNSRQKHLYVSQPQNDFIFSIIAEELGFAGAALVVILFMLLIWRGFVIALKAPDTFSTLIVIGLISKVAIQALLNIAVVTNLIPNTGISLPFFSYGGTALMMQLGEMGIILSISRFSYQRKDTMKQSKELV